jgi:hypothetical protein
VDFSSLDTRIRDFSLVAPSSVPGPEGEHEVLAAALATSNGKILVSGIVRRSEERRGEERGWKGMNNICQGLQTVSISIFYR